MDLKNAVQLLKADLICYRGDQGKHGRLKQKIAKELLITLLKFSTVEQDNEYCVDFLILSYLLSSLQQQLLRLKCNSSGILDSIVKKYILQFNNSILIH